MRQQKFEQLKKIIVKELPEIMELKFGCRMSNKHQNDDNPYKTKTLIRKRDLYYCIEFDGKVLNYPCDALEILGREITLTDVLRVMTEKKQSGCCNKTNTMFLDADFYALMEDWQLGKPLQDQSDKVYDFLLDVLK